ncbi:MAG: methyltransferase domain-containing protein [Chloroflexi bacterium]|nr:MAG: methyltransferase domain-containing protein [Chloroflexota bacterium]
MVERAPSPDLRVGDSNPPAHRHAIRRITSVRRSQGGMKARLVPLLACPSCGVALQLRESQLDRDGEIATGELVCRQCTASYAIRNGVPRLLPPESSRVSQQTSAAFGWQWRQFVELYDEYEAQFLDWIHPIQPDFFRGKVVLDAGCGNGRHAFYAARYGARDVVAMDFSDAVDTAYENIGTMPNAHVVQGDINHPRVPVARAVRKAGRRDLRVGLRAREQRRRARLHKPAPRERHNAHPAIGPAGDRLAHVRRPAFVGEGRLQAAPQNSAVQGAAVTRVPVQPVELQLSQELQHRVRSPGRARRLLPAARRVRKLVPAQQAAGRDDQLAEPQLVARFWPRRGLTKNSAPQRPDIMDSEIHRNSYGGAAWRR